MTERSVHSRGNGIANRCRSRDAPELASYLHVTSTI
jgi:hypothetical protein